MAGMEPSEILTWIAAFVGGFVGAVGWYFLSQRRSPKLHVPGSSPWPVEPLPRIVSERIPDGAITTGKIARGVITPDDLAAGDLRDGR